MGENKPGLLDLGVAPALPSWVGNKAQSLNVLIRLSKFAVWNVPSGFVVDPVLTKRQDVLRRAQRDLEAGPIIVRSSTSLEDTRGRSHAGLFSSRVVDGASELDAALRELPREAQRTAPSAGVALIIQRYVSTAVGGVAFGAHPCLPQGVAVVSTGLGQPSGVTAGTVTTDEFLVDQSSHLPVSTTVGHKRLQVAWDPAAGVELLRPSDPRLRNQPCLDDGRLSELSRATVALEQALGWPVDVEFGYDADKALWLLQARPTPPHRCHLARDTMTALARRRCAAQRMGWATPNRWLANSAGLIELSSSESAFGELFYLKKLNAEDGEKVDALSMAAAGRKVPQALWVVEQFVPSDVGGLCEHVGSATVIEFARGHVGGVTRGLVEPSRRVVSDHGRVECSIGDGLDLQIMRRLHELSQACRAELGPGPIEWALRGHELFFLDITSTFRIGSDSARLIQGGTATGVVRTLSTDDRSITHDGPAFHCYSPVTAPDGTQDRFVYVATLPRVELARLIPTAAAFVFRQGPTLCHLAILLMEHAIPAIIDREAFEMLKDGKRITITDGRVVHERD